MKGTGLNSIILPYIGVIVKHYILRFIKGSGAAANR